ncbi:MAG: hypothetical protein PWQ29_1084 [Verrucomicrobiota bacterium]|nr:hypothetical protein [Verrucomicrobiota bacterium]MDK2963690.1 hypothetical protein [Verrucomicrobiota bacterium]
MKRVLIIAAASVITALSAPAQDDADLAELKQQLQALSAKIEQIEKQQAEKIEDLEKRNREQIAQFKADSTAEIEQIKSSTAEIPDWVRNVEFHGDLRYRYENSEVDNDNTKDRQRVRVRIGAYSTVNDSIDYGVRLSTGGDSATSGNETLGDGFKKDDVDFDLYYVDIHPESFWGTHLLMGKMNKPWIKGSGLIWDGDVNPEGIALQYDHQFGPVKLISSAGSFVMEEDKGDDVRLWSAQAAAETKIKSAKLLAGASWYGIDNLGSGSLDTGFNNPDSDFNLVEGFGSIRSEVKDLPVKVHGQYVVNTEAEYDDDTAYLVGIVLGKAKIPGSWEAGYNWRDTGRDAVLDAFNDSDFGGGDTGSYGHQLQAKYQISRNFQAGATYFNTVNGDGDDEDTLQLDLNFRF